MSFILEALKKSEQQRQQQNDQPQKVRKRTLSLQSDRSNRRLLPWLLIALIPLILLGGWLVYRGSGAIPPTSPTAGTEQAVDAPAHISQSSPSEPLVVTPPASSEPQQPVEPVTPSGSVPQTATLEVEPAPVPRPFGSSRDTAIKTKPATDQTKMTASRQADSSTSRGKPVDETVPTVSFGSPLPQTSRENVSSPVSTQLPLYTDLSKELRAQMPALDMSMHYYTPEPGPRMVRINDHLLREGNWVDSNLQVVEITANGAILDFLGKTFELRRTRR